MEAEEKRRWSDDARWIILRMNTYFSPGDIAAYTGVPLRTVQRILSQYETSGTVKQAPSVYTRGRPKCVSPLDAQFLAGSIARTPDMFLDELQTELERVQGIHASQSTIWRKLTEMGFTMKVITKNALERSEIARAEFKFTTGMAYTADQLVFVDESSCDRRTTYRDVAWALKGQRVRKAVYFHRGKRYSILPALSLDGMLCVHIVEGSFDTVKFAEFIELLLEHMNPYPEKNSVIVMDNAKIHKAPLIREMIEERGMRIAYLPAYSPDFNPIELAFSAIKAQLKRDGSNIRATMESDDAFDIYAALHEAVFSVTAEDALGWYHKCGYL